MGKLIDKWKFGIPIILFAASVVISSAGCSSNFITINSDQAKNSSAKLTIFPLSKFAAPFRLIAGTLLETSNFPVYLPTYLPSPPDERMEWLLNLDNLDVSKNKFGIEIDEGQPGAKGGIYAGTLSGNIGAPPESPLEKQIISESREVKNINLPNGITGKEYTPKTIPLFSLDYATDKHYRQANSIERNPEIRTGIGQ